MKKIGNINIWRILKILCIILCAVFLFAACSSEDNGSLPRAQDDSDMGDVSNGTLAKEQRQCIQEGILEKFYTGLSSMALKVYSQLTSEDLLSLMVLAFSLWMAFQVLRHVSATTPESLGEFWTKILRKGAICFACGYLASSSENILYTINTFVFPIYITLLQFASSILEMMGNGHSSASLQVPGDMGLNEEISHQMTDSGCSISGAGIKMTSGAFPQEPLKMMGCMACTVNDRLSVGYSIAVKVLFGTNLFGFFVGLFLVVAFTLTKWGFVLYLVDSIFRLTMMIIIMPFLILFYAFEQTRKWTNTGFKIILNSAALMLCLAILVSMTIFAMEDMLKNKELGNFGDIGAYESFGTVPLSMMLMGFCILKAAGTAVSLSESITGGSGDTSFQKKMAALVGTVAAGVFALVTMGAGKIALIAGKYSARAQAAMGMANKARNKFQQFRGRLNQMAGRDEDGRGGV